ncbi:hypothetical protein SteCoe_17113 [Stentor coeruleus]|uniref:Cyclic nucleotide-binding domain-containing protein n=1 Tax=Stentor coeruleus TaxID=5963 RepID=A0A1R2BZS6_9CILI|nr:hypothetical protein SteCoe_17113 [Stentor coeruleus]
METEHYHITEDITVKDIKDEFSEDSSGILLGTSIEPTTFDNFLSNKKAEKSKISFSFSSLKKLSGAIVSVRSIYKKCLITHRGRFKSYWEVIMELILAYNIITTLYFLAYQQPSGGMLVFDLVCWILFIIDIGLTFFTEFLDEKGYPIQSFRKIAFNYLTGSLIFDILAIIPLRNAGYPRAEYLLRMFRLLKLPGVIDLTDGTGVSYLLTYFCIGKREKDGKITYSFTTKIIASLVKLFIIIIFIVYFLGCFWYWFQNVVSNYKYSLEKSGNDENTFERFFITDDLESKDIALRSSYFMLTTIATIGYGDFLPKNVYEMAFILVIMLFGVTLFAVIMGNFNSAIAYYTQATSGVDYAGELNSWLESIERMHGIVDKKLKTSLTEHFKYYFEKDRLKSLAKNYWEANSSDDLISISQGYVSNLPEEIYYQILENLFSDILHNFKYFFGSTKLKYALLPHFQPRRFLKDEYIFSCGADVTEIYFLLTGNISIGYNVNGEHQTLLFCEEGRTIIGDYQILTRVKNKFDYLAETNVDAYALDGETFNKIINSFFKEEKSGIMAIAVKRENNLKRLLNDHIKNLKVDTTMNESDKKLKTVIPREVGQGDKLDEYLIENKLTEFSEQTKDAEQMTKKVLALMKFTEDLRNKNYKNLT